MNDVGEELIVRFSEAVEDAIEQGSDLSSVRIEFRFRDGEGELCTYGYGDLDDRHTGSA